MAKRLELSEKRNRTALSRFNIYEDGFFNPFCPYGYNYLTGMIETVYPNHSVNEPDLTIVKKKK